MRRTYDEQDCAKPSPRVSCEFLSTQVRMIDGAVAGVEALVRWQHPDDGLVFPSDFIPLVEQSGLSDELAGAVAGPCVPRGNGVGRSGARVSVMWRWTTFALDLPEKVVNAASRQAFRPNAWSSDHRKPRHATWTGCLTSPPGCA
jgi:hypothetical protein